MVQIHTEIQQHTGKAVKPASCVVSLNAVSSTPLLTAFSWGIGCFLSRSSIKCLASMHKGRI